MTKDNDLYAEIKRANELEKQLKIAMVALEFYKKEESYYNYVEWSGVDTEKIVITAKEALSDMMKVNGSLPRTDR